jgi:uncharacterized protein YqjF (DUF2071 family)
MNKTFLTAEWQYLVMVNYEVDPDILLPWLPPCTELDTFEQKTLVSLVGFNFRKTRMLSVYWPFHVDFPEVNLRFYVKYFNGQQWKRGVAFVSEIVPRHAIAYTASLLYHEPYRCMPMRQQVTVQQQQIQATYEWKFRGEWNRLQVKAKNLPAAMQPGTEEAFIFDHYWGYNRYNERITIEYEVEHPSWQTYPVTDWEVKVNAKDLYGTAFAHYLQQTPSSVLLAHGSPVIVRRPARIIKQAL